MGTVALPMQGDLSFVTRKDGLSQVIAQFEPGVYITVDALPNGVKAFKRVRCSKRRFAEQQAKELWNKNKDGVFKKYPPPLMTSISHAGTSSNPSNARENDAAQSSKY